MQSGGAWYLSIKFYFIHSKYVFFPLTLSMMGLELFFKKKAPDLIQFKFK